MREDLHASASRREPGRQRGREELRRTLRRGSPAVWLAGVATLVAAVSIGVGLATIQPRAPQHRQIVAIARGAKIPPLNAENEARILAFCADCHKVPIPRNLPQTAWHDAVLEGYEFYARSGRNDLIPPPAEMAVRYFRSRAPAVLSFPEPKEATRRLAARFVSEQIPGSGVAPAVANLRWTRLSSSAQPLLLACDMRNGSVTAVDLGTPDRSRRELSRLNNPCHLETCDLDLDGVLDVVVADLGSFTPDDHNLGRVVWLRGRGEHGQFEEVVLADGMGRVADVRPCDVDADGDLDLIVAEFGLYSTGQIVLLRNVARTGEMPHFEPEPIDPRPGTIHVPIHDLNGDGRPDFLALVSQEFESVEAFINAGAGRFRSQALWSAPDLTFGSSGIEPVDLDRDGDLDIVYTNGDAFDNAYANPSHGVQWLENCGELRFAYHRLTDLVGAFRAMAGDIDMDGDLDILAVSWLPEEVKPVALTQQSMPSLLCLEQTESGEFVRHTLASGSPRNASLELADFDSDGDLDFAVGAVGAHWLTIWWNQMINE